MGATVHPQHERRHRKGDDERSHVRMYDEPLDGVVRDGPHLVTRASGMPRAEGTCWSAMTTAIPAVKPSITDTGRKRT